jgi:hypothetical protein
VRFSFNGAMRRNGARFALIAVGKRVSGRSETKTYGKSAVVRACDGAENSPKKKLLRERYGCKITCFQCIARSSRSHRGTLFGKVVAHRYRETVSSIAVGVSFIGKNTGLQMFEILCVLRYRRF